MIAGTQIGNLQSASRRFHGGHSSFWSLDSLVHGGSNFLFQISMSSTFKIQTSKCKRSTFTNSNPKIMIASGF